MTASARCRADGAASALHSHEDALAAACGRAVVTSASGLEVTARTDGYGRLIDLTVGENLRGHRASDVRRAIVDAIESAALDATEHRRRIHEQLLAELAAVLR